MFGRYFHLELSSSATPQRSRLRKLGEFGVAVVIGVTCLTTFALESFEVVSSSMYPTLIGPNVRFVCPMTGEAFLLPTVESPHSLRKLFCPQCGAVLPAGDLPLRAGDRLIVDRATYQFREPRRFEPVVVRRLNERGGLETIVKRVVGLPGESVQIRSGDIYINGQLAAKSLRQLRGFAIPVVDFAHLAKAQCQLAIDASDKPETRERDERWPSATLWDDSRQAFVIDSNRLVYTPQENKPGLITDQNAANQLFTRNENELTAVRDLLLIAGSVRVRSRASEADLAATLVFTLSNGREKLELQLKPESSAWLARQNGAELAAGTDPTLSETIRRGGSVELAIVDGTFQAAIADQQLFQLPVSADVPDQDANAQNGAVVQIEALGCEIEIRELQLASDVYYTSPPGLGPRAGLIEPFLLGMDEYFVLGDNSAISDDSRFWADPAIRRRQIVGRPLLVHWPGDRTDAWNGWIQVPSVDKIRYIR